MNRRLFVDVCRRLFNPRRPRLQGGVSARHRSPQSLPRRSSHPSPQPAAFSAVCIIALSCGLLLTNPAWAPAADLPNDIRTADDVTPYKSTIDQYIQGQVAAISADDPKPASVARESLIDEVRGLVPPSPAFLDAYCSELQTYMTPLTAPSASIRVRLNAAIVVAKVANTTQDARLSPMVITELNDPNEAVVLWGLKAAYDVLPSALSIENLKVKLISAVLKAAERLNNGPIIAAAYTALDVIDHKPPAAPAELITPMQNLLTWRIQQYAAAAPAEPPADGRATAFLTERNVWLSQNASQQKTTVQLLADLVGVAIVGQATAQPEDRDEFTQLLTSIGKAIEVIGINNNDPQLQNAAKPLTLIDQRPPPTTPLVAAAQAVNGLAIKFPPLRIPKVLAATVPAPMPAPAPAPAAAP